MTEEIGFKQKFGFALGHVLNDMAACMTVTYELVFFHKILLLDNLYSGLLVLIGQVFDGFATIFVGIFSDKGDDLWLCNKIGRRKAWHIIGCFCVAARLF